MPHEIALFDALVPGLLVLFLIVAVLAWILDSIAGRYDLYRYVWHPPLFRAAVLLGLFSALGLLLFGGSS
ncbi:DUF1656 domain-containing protein [Burkholderia cenocepacia]|uniref:DUF1656 domain-containing protein n=1 Tax=Burkholderia cenocepacia TaxID=95486 RepID=UPI000DD5F83B|nr:DUF1656 domain-containing protein [Burkholderia cenocepacia]MCW3505796.1 DUF1656 domain-containing protein [Burkholderia cenocepacia]MCW3513354.1 DUF1656 domain-containing protein [Burkholderia cenocepacia]MCW3520967.1 DUF1656 domain-containing protein [Burkholderia cenocepacia]MCW3536108.1 DUF1656 domain-containing protein [Burkholderia cenocepacia]MCW3551163.1 DUF1656 domain-containing protein [Burkholderia cenocepacia]